LQLDGPRRRIYETIGNGRSGSIVHEEGSPMTTTLEDLITAARRTTMTPQQQEAQRRSFAYGNTNIENDDITRDVIDEAARSLDAENGKR
jgi:hypothetical protein